MKRVLVVLLALVMGAGLAIAADQAPPKWGAYVEGWAVFYDQAGQAGLTPNWSGTGQFTDLSFTYAEANVGFSFVGEFGGANWGNPLRNMSGWYQVLPMLKLTAGKIRDASYRPATYVEGSGVYTRQANAEWGLLAQVTPVKNLSVGAFVKFPEGMAAQDYMNNLAFGASYAVDGIGTFYAQYRTMGADEFGVAAKITAIKALPLLIGYKMSDIFTFAVNTFNFSTQYVAGALTASLDFRFILTGDTGNPTDFGDEVSVAYKLNPTYTAGLNFGYGEIAYSTGATGGGLFVYPWFSAAVGSASSLKLGFILDTDYSGEGLAWSIPLRYVFSF